MSIRFQEIYHKYAGLVFSVSNRIVLSPSVAEEIVQETFVRYFERAEGLDNDDPKYWLVKVATNLCFDELRRRTRSRLELFSTFSRLIPMFTTTIGTKVSNRLSSKLVLENMNPQERALVVLRFVLDYSYLEIAEIFGLPEGTVKSKMSRLLERLREEMKNIG